MCRIGVVVVVVATTAYFGNSFFEIYRKTPFIRTMVIWIGLALWVNCLEIAGYRVRYSTLLRLLESGVVKDAVHTVNSNSRTSNCHCSLFSKKNPIIQILCISGWLAVPVNLDKCSSTELIYLFLFVSTWLTLSGFIMVYVVI